ncbi:hypothetical protein [Aliihoeflea sp. 2WW]|uniref:hypothetical protein n=1 Tax=Aliihoeflea sp. 2WW TaxID=1381123 RepID=UPI001FCBAC3A|nr:hypothetical protein [Aliihoeflea sp. 2WW]
MPDHRRQEKDRRRQEQRYPKAAAEIIDHHPVASMIVSGGRGGDSLFRRPSFGVLIVIMMRVGMIGNHGWSFREVRATS